MTLKNLLKKLQLVRRKDKRYVLQIFIWACNENLNYVLKISWKSLDFVTSYKHELKMLKIAVFHRIRPVIVINLKIVTSFDTCSAFPQNPISIQFSAYIIIIYISAYIISICNWHR